MRIALGIEYDGSQYCGWQRQKDVISVQQCVEQALSQIAATPVQVQCAGRTDTGVHATGQVVHFDVDAERPERAWTLGMNTLLPSTVAVRWVQPVGDDFHARFSATARRYRYIICNQPFRSGILSQGVTHIHAPLDAQLMQQAALCLLGEHDFSAFRALHCQAKTAIRTIQNITIHRYNNFIVVDIQANAFLHHMVRNIVGSLIEVGKGAQSQNWIAELLAGRDRAEAAATAKPNGLYLVDVCYPARFILPRVSLGPLFLPLEDF